MTSSVTLLHPVYLQPIAQTQRFRLANFMAIFMSLLLLTISLVS